MVLHSIPFEVVIAILDFAYPVSFSDYWLWNPALSLVHVCRSWRNHVLPKLHGTAYVLTARNIETYSEDCAYLFNGTLNASVSLGHGHYVKKIVVIDNYYLPLPQLKTSTPDTWTPLDFPDNMWPGLTQLHVNAYACTLPDDQKDSYLCSIPKSSGKFLQYLPNVATFVFKFANDDYFVSASAYRAVDAISVVVDGTSLSTEPQSYCLYLDSYTQISAHYSSESIPIQSYYTLTSLDRLAFMDVPKPITWSGPFGFITDETILNLYKLNHLELRIRDVPMSWRTDITSKEQLNVPHPAYQLRFPNLQRLVIFDPMRNSGFLAYFSRALPLVIRHVSLYGNIEDVSATLSVIPKIGKLDVSLWEEVPNNFDVRLFFDAAFGPQSVASIATLSAESNNFPVNLGNACWPRLVKLTLDNCISIDYMFELLDCLPNLEKLHIACISEGGPDNSTDINWDTVLPLKPLNTKVWLLEVGDDRHSDVDYFPVKCILCLAARLVNLQTVILEHCTPIDTSGFMDELHDKYPHTTGISVNFKLISDS